MCNQEREIGVENVAVLLSMSASLDVRNVDAIVYGDERKLPGDHQCMRVMYFGLWVEAVAADVLHKYR